MAFADVPSSQQHNQSRKRPTAHSRSVSACDMKPFELQFSLLKLRSQYGTELFAGGLLHTTHNLWPFSSTDQERLAYRRHAIRWQNEIQLPNPVTGRSLPSGQKEEREREKEQ